MILLLLLLLALPILGLIALFAAPLIGLLTVAAVPVIAGLAVVAAPAVAIAGLAGAFSNAHLSVPALQTLEVLGIAVGVIALIAALAYIVNQLASSTRVPALRPREVPVRVREQTIIEPQRQAAVRITEKTLPEDVGAQCQGMQLVPCPV